VHNRQDETMSKAKNIMNDEKSSMLWLGDNVGNEPRSSLTAAVERSRVLNQLLGSQSQQTAPRRRHDESDDRDARQGWDLSVRH
jgi:hypothetical protein